FASGAASAGAAEVGGAADSACSALNASALNPFHTDSMSTTAPRKNGLRRNRAFGQSVSQASSRTAICPSGRRTATTRLAGERIITPSRTACPPMYGRSLTSGGGRPGLRLGLRCLLRRRAGGRLRLVLLTEPLHATLGVDQLVLAGEE